MSLGPESTKSTMTRYRLVPSASLLPVPRCQLVASGAEPGQVAGGMAASRLQLTRRGLCATDGALQARAAVGQPLL